MWVLIGMLLGSTVTSTHTDREACEGRKVILAEKSVTGLKCENMQTLTWSTTLNSNSIPAR